MHAVSSSPTHRPLDRVCSEVSDRAGRLSHFGPFFTALEPDGQRVLFLFPGYLAGLLAAEMCAARVVLPIRLLLYGGLLLLLLGHAALSWDRPFRCLPLVLSAAPAGLLALSISGDRAGWSHWAFVGLPVLAATALALRSLGLLPSIAAARRSLALYAWGGLAALGLVAGFLLFGLLAIPCRLFSWLRRVVPLGLDALRSDFCPFLSRPAFAWPTAAELRFYLVRLRGWLCRLQRWLDSPRPLRIALQAMVLLPAVLGPLLSARSVDVQPSFSPRANWRIVDYMSSSSPPADAAVGADLAPGPDRSLGRLMPGRPDAAVRIDDAAEIRRYVRPSRRAESAPEPAPPSPATISLEQYPDCPAAGYGNPYPRGVCTWYAQGRREDLPVFSGLFGLAENWAVSAQLCGFQVDQRPAVGAVIVFPPGANGASPGGHVGYVEAVGEDYVLISECNVTYGSPVAISPTWWEAGYYCAHRQISFDWLDPRVQYIHEHRDRSPQPSQDWGASVK